MNCTFRSGTKIYLIKSDSKEITIECKSTSENMTLPLSDFKTFLDWMKDQVSNEKTKADPMPSIPQEEDLWDII